MLAKMLHHHGNTNADDDHEPKTNLIHGLKDGAGDDDDDQEETLSFCEFSIHNDADLWGDSYRESSKNSSFKSSEEEEEGEAFEFFGQEFWRGTAAGSSSFSSHHPPPENIIFCGKLISYKEPTSENIKTLDSVRLRKHKRISKRRIFRWQWRLFRLSSSSHNKTKTRRTKCSKKKSTREEEEEEENSWRLVPQRSRQRKGLNKEHNLSAQNISSRRWYLVFFGTTRFRTKMELRDMKWRQSHGRSSSSFHRDNNHTNHTNTSLCVKKGNIFWALLRALSCLGGGHHQIM